MNGDKLASAIRDIPIRGSGRLSLLIAKLLNPKPKGEVVVETQYGFQLRIDAIKGKGLEKDLYYFGTYEKGTLFILKHLLKEGDTFVDIGANIGLHSIYASGLVKDKGQVISFEPHPLTRMILEENIRINNIRNIVVEPYAIGSTNETVIIYDISEKNRGSASLIRPGQPSHKYEVPMIALSEYFKSETNIKVIKIDIEGYELEAIKGARKILMRPDRPIIITECSTLRENTFGNDLSAMYDLLKEFNYRIFRSMRGKEFTSKLTEVKHAGQLPLHDNIFCLTEDHFTLIPEYIFKDL